MAAGANVTITREATKDAQEFVLHINGARMGSLDYAVPEAGVMRIDYVEVRDADDLEAVSAPIRRPVVLALAVKFGATRLIDNRVLDPR